MNLKLKDVLIILIFNTLLLGIILLTGGIISSYIVFGVILGNLQFIILILFKRDA